MEFYRDVTIRNRPGHVDVLLKRRDGTIELFRTVSADVKEVIDSVKKARAHMAKQNALESDSAAVARQVRQWMQENP